MNEKHEISSKTVLSDLERLLDPEKTTGICEHCKVVPLKENDHLYCEGCTREIVDYLCAKWEDFLTGQGLY